MFDKEISGEVPEHRTFIYETAIPWLRRAGLNVKILRANTTYKECFTKTIQRGKGKGKLKGFPLCGRCNIQRDCKVRPIQKYMKSLPQDTQQYVGLATDEQDRLMRLQEKQISLLEQYACSESEAWELCHRYGLLSPVYDFTDRNGCWFCPNAKLPERLVRSVYFEPNQLKIEMDKMLLEHKDSIHVMCHSWGTRPIMDGDTIKGVYFESKEGRKAVLAKIVIDATGDGDIFRQTGCPYFGLADKLTRCATTALVWRIGGCNWDLFCEWKKTNHAAAAALHEGFSKVCGFRAAPLPGPTNDVCWINNWHPERDCSNLKDATETEMETRDTMRNALEYLRKACPVAFRNAFLYDIAPQLGTRCSYRLDGEYVITPNDFAFPQEHEDVIAWHSTISFINDNCPIEIPYRAILPKKTENLLCPGRHISADEIGIDYVNLIPQCVGTGQAAGVAAAVAIADGTTAHKVNIKKVQDILARDQDVPLPRNPYTDPSYMQNVVDHEYGLYTQLAKNAREKAGYLSGVRQFGANQGEIVDSDSKSIKGGGDAQLNPNLIKATPQH